MFRKKHYILFFIIILTLTLSACKKEDEPLIETSHKDISKIIELIVETEKELEANPIDGIIKEIEEEIAESDVKTDRMKKEVLRERIEKEIIGKAPARLPQYVEFGATWKDFEYKDEIIDFMDKAWKIAPYFNLDRQMSAFMMTYKYDYDEENPNKDLKDIKKMLDKIMEEYGAIFYSENFNFKSIEDLKENRMYAAFEADEYYLGTYLVYIPKDETIELSMIYFSKLYAHLEGDDYYPLLVHMEKAIRSKKQYPDLYITRINSDGTTITYRKNYEADEETKTLLRYMAKPLPDPEERTTLEEKAKEKHRIDEDDSDILEMIEQGITD